MISNRLKGHQPFILMALRHGPQTQSGLRSKYERLLHYMGLPVTFATDDRGWTFHRELEANLASLMKRGFVVREGAAYRLTAQGEAAANAAYERARQKEDSFMTLAYRPAIASKVSVVSNGFLSILKLLTGFMFMSLSLLADGVDSLIDVLSSAIVLLGVRVGREFTSAAFMIAVTGVLGGAVMYEGVLRFMQPASVEARVGAIAVAVLSGGISFVLGLYQRNAGREGGSLALLSQSIESRKHVFQAGLVAVALLLSRQGLVQADSVVAIAIGFLILRSSVELALDVVRVARIRADSSTGKDQSTSDFGRQRWNFFKMWTLLTLREVHNRRDVMVRYDQTFTPDDLPYATHRSPAAGFDYRKNYAGIIEELFDEGLVTSEGDELLLSELGRKRLRDELRRRRFGFFV
ncbi:MAG: cation diffusion facilitator family transporter [Chloroflexota bacterium]